MAARKKPKDEPELVKMAELSKRSGVPGPTIKHYIREGLLPGPEVRTSRNMAYYDARLAGRIRVIKQLQGERFLPLRVIADLLEPAPSADIRPDREAAHKSALTQLAPALERGDRTGQRRRKRSEVMKTFGVTRAQLEALEKLGVFDLKGEGDTAGYTGIDLDLLDILADVRGLGLGEIFPISIAEPYFAAVKALATIEIDIFRHRALGHVPAGDLPDVARQAMELGERLIAALRAKILPGMLAKLSDR